MSRSQRRRDAVVAFMARRWVWAPAMLIVVLALAGVILRWVWLPQYRPRLREGEVYGVDVSNHQGEIDWEAVAGDNIEFAFIKASEGGDFVDRRFTSNWEGARAAGLEVGAYHFFTLCRPGAEQAANFLGVVPPGEADLAPALDLEVRGNCSARPPADTVRAEVAAWIEKVEEETGRRVLLYVGPDFDSLYDITGKFSGPTWQRRILRRPPGERWEVWQLSYFADVHGIDGGVDLDVMRPPD